ncbi:hypothetical protein [Sphingobium lignivorans]|uniref:Transposase n=1 Tax=Sphingobium lignivorans TaxID=2735886 RepID=A0ABR6NFE3_9SPHN|nr:hypothetical protein [Sphingobium lignivorans]MBB5985981.1 hypothetical protein [Sphingobium lignivorans]
MLRYGEAWLGQLPAGAKCWLAMAYELDELRGKLAKAEQKIQRLEALRPHWAKGYSSDSVAALVKTTALSEIWALLGVRDQTSAMLRLRELTEKSA